MTHKLEELKRQQAEIEQQIKLEQLKKEQESIQKEIEVITKTTPSHQDKHAVNTAISRQETYKGKLINLENSQYHISGVIQRFETIDEAKNYIDSQNNYAAYSPQNYQPPKSHKKWMFALILSVVIIGFLSYKDRNEKGIQKQSSESTQTSASSANKFAQTPAQPVKQLYCVWEAQRNSENTNWESAFLGKDNPGKLTIKGETVSYGSNKIFVSHPDRPPINRNGSKIFLYLGENKSLLQISYTPQDQILISLTFANETVNQVAIQLAGSCIPL